MNKLADPLPDSLYHYTNQNGFKGILKSESIWLVNHKKQSDKKEVISHDELIQEHLNITANSDFGDLVADLFKRLKLASSLDRHEILEADVGLYIACFTNNPDNPKLWEDDYAGPNGYVIEINREKAKIKPPSPCTKYGAMTKEIINEPVVGLAACQKVQYLSKDQLSENICNIIQSDFEPNKLLNSLYAQMVLNEIYADIYCTKLSEYRDEEEYRLYVPYHITTAPLFSKLGPIEEGKFIFSLPHKAIIGIYTHKEMEAELKETLKEQGLPESLIKILP
jgi:hypothetical protein